MVDTKIITMKYLVLYIFFSFLCMEVDAQISARTSKTDVFLQKDIDILLAANQLSWNGLRIENKKLDFANLSKGSYRGTIFKNCNLIKMQAINDTLSSKIDFLETIIEKCPLKNAHFSFWKIHDCSFVNSRIIQTNFNNTDFSNLAIPGLATFNVDTIESCTFNTPNAGGLNSVVFSKSIIKDCSFLKVKMNNTNAFSTTFQNCIFSNGTIKNCSWGGSMSQSKIVGGKFENVVIQGGSYDRLVFDSFGLSKVIFEKVEIVSAIFTNVSLKVWIRGGSKFYGLNNFSGNNFKNSIIEDAEFGSSLGTVLFNMKNSNFSKVEFRNNIKFEKCDLTGSLWPANMSGVTFIGCKGCTFSGCSP